MITHRQEVILEKLCELTGVRKYQALQVYWNNKHQNELKYKGHDQQQREAYISTIAYLLERL